MDPEFQKNGMFAPMFTKRKIRVAILDLYEAEPNQGMRCLREILDRFAEKNNLVLVRDEFEVRIQKQLPDLSYDVYISTGGPGSPLESENTEWENAYFNWLGEIESYNKLQANQIKKKVFFICHSFQLACRYYQIASVARRKSTAFGVFPIYLKAKGLEDPVFSGLRDPFYAVDSRDYQVIQPDKQKLMGLGAEILAIEKDRPHVALERAIMAIRFNDQMIGTQFHPEADASGMSMYLKREDKKKMVIEEYGEEKWRSMVDQLNDPDKIQWTNTHVIPNFLDSAVHFKS
jgi:homoserine O-succinyltransferase/O-acetyltransferase